GGDPVSGVHLHDAEVTCITEGNGNRADGQVGASLEMGADHVAVVHLVNVVAGENQNVLRVRLLDAVDVLVHGVGRAFVPVLIDALLRGQHFNVLFQLTAQETPA